MLRYKTRLTVHKKNEDTNIRDTEFDYPPELVSTIKEHIEFKLHNVHFVDNEGNVYIITVSNIEVLM